MFTFFFFFFCFLYRLPPGAVEPHIHLLASRYGACTDDRIAEEPRLASTSPRRAVCSRPSSSWSPASAREQHRARQSGRRAAWADGERSLCTGLGAWSARTASAWADGQRSRDGACVRPARMGAQPGRSRGLRGRQARPARTGAQPARRRVLGGAAALRTASAACAAARPGRRRGLRERRARPGRGRTAARLGRRRGVRDDGAAWANCERSLQSHRRPPLVETAQRQTRGFFVPRFTLDVISHSRNGFIEFPSLSSLIGLPYEHFA